MDSVDVSLIIVTRNTCDLLQRALESIRNSEDSLVKEVIVVDNGSDPETPQMVSSLFPQAIYLPQGRNLGFAQANNIGAQQAHGAFICLLNSDARLKPHALSTAVGFLRENSRCGIVGAQLLNTDGTPQNSIANDPNLSTELLNKSLLRRLFPERFPGKNQVYSMPIEVESVIGAFLLTRDDLWKKLGGLDERYFFFLEETDYCRRVRQLGSTVVHLPQVEVWHDQGQSVKKVQVPARIEYWRSRYTYFQQHFPGWQQWILRFGLLIRLLIGSLANFLLQPLSSKIRDKFHLQQALVLWHLRGCPPDQGLAKLAPP